MDNFLVDGGGGGSVVYQYMRRNFFFRKVYKNSRAYALTIPIEIVRAFKIQRGDQIFFKVCDEDVIQIGLTQNIKISVEKFPKK